MVMVMVMVMVTAILVSLLVLVPSILEPERQCPPIISLRYTTFFLHLKSYDEHRSLLHDVTLVFNTRHRLREPGRRVTQRMIHFSGGKNIASAIDERRMHAYSYDRTLVRQAKDQSNDCLILALGRCAGSHSRRSNKSALRRKS